jgi:hypothetical protein
MRKLDEDIKLQKALKGLLRAAKHVYPQAEKIRYDIETEKALIFFAGGETAEFSCTGMDGLACLARAVFEMQKRAR